MHAGPALEESDLDNDLDRVEDLLPLWQRFGAEEAEERRAAACRQFLDLAPKGAIERLLAVNLVVVQAAALDCLQRDPDTLRATRESNLRQGTRLMDLCLRFAKTLSREQAARRREAAAATEAEAAALPETPALQETPVPGPAAAAPPAGPKARAKEGPAATSAPWHRSPDRAPHCGEEPGSEQCTFRSGPPGHAPPAKP